MSSRGDMTIFNEPFSARYYFGPDRRNTRYPAEDLKPEHDLHRRRDELIAAAESAPVFFKDMAYHITGEITPEFLEPFQSSVLVRSPEYSIPSLYKKMPDFTMEETGFDRLAELTHTVAEIDDQPPFVMDGESLREDPAAVYRDFCAHNGLDFDPEALHWEKGGEEHWGRWQDWYTEAANSEGIRPPAAKPAPEILAVPKVAEAIARTMPIYEEILELCA